MKEPLQSSGPVCPGNPRAVGRRKHATCAALVTVAVLGCLAGWQIASALRSSTAAPALAPTDVESAHELDGGPDPALRSRPAEDAASVSEPDEAADPVASAGGSLAAASPTTRSALPLAEPTPFARQLVVNLTQLDLSHGPLTQEQADQWKTGLLALVQQGRGAVPAVREFLELNLDWDLGPRSLLGYPSIRAGLLDALQQIGGPEAQTLMLQTLQTTSMPAEIARLATYLEQQGPGQFRPEIGTAVRETLDQAAAGQLRGWDVGPLFQVWQSYGDTTVVADLEKSASKWSYYSALALANLPGGEGIPSLIRLTQESVGSLSRGVALEALAQVAVQYPRASAALVELARSGDFSEKNWSAAASALAGDRYFIRDTGLENGPALVGPGIKNYHLEVSNQNFYSRPAWEGMSTEQINQRVAIIDQLLAANSNASVAQALENARVLLLTRGQPASAN